MTPSRIVRDSVHKHVYALSLPLRGLLGIGVDGVQEAIQDGQDAELALDRVAELHQQIERWVEASE